MILFASSRSIATLLHNFTRFAFVFTVTNSHVEAGGECKPLSNRAFNLDPIVGCPGVPWPIA
jgi:hypothetical protein